MAMMRLFLLVVASILPFAQAQATTNYFISPPVPEGDNQFQNNPVYTVGDQIKLQWQTNYTRVSLIWWQNNNDSYQTVDGLENVVSSSPFTWNLSLTGKFSLKGGNVFFFQMYDAGSNSQTMFSSHYFNITDKSSTTSSTTSSSSSATPTPTSSTTSSSATGISTAPAATSAAATSAAAEASHSSGGLSSGAKVGLGVGVGLGVVALVGLGAILALLFRRRRENHTQLASAGTPAMQHQQPMSPAPQSQEYPFYAPSTHGSQAPAYAHYDNTPPPNVFGHGNTGAHTHMQPSEMPANAQRSELDAAHHAEKE
ncbi:hypothetical protein K461DRAFT_291057 [Myriangium duriaei CBS 260.36]|uniref:Mid2 domain-containing protein n=1 Tax=Myriangium duriaei CBS 260.36 TaxID=1168546 RepID=A0A9P4MNC7_9PEZI|nr:hypothetical protein K461DRAFT_291057 [Myriangium duriaei CBS 260.36]